MLCPQQCNAVCSYKLGHSEVHTSGASDTPLLMHASPALVQAAEHGTSDRQDNDNASQPDQQLVHRLQRLESDMTKVRLCSSLQDINQMHCLSITVDVVQVQNMLLLHSERLDHMGTDERGCQQPLIVTPIRQPAG